MATLKVKPARSGVDGVYDVVHETVLVGTIAKKIEHYNVQSRSRNGITSVTWKAWYGEEKIEGYFTRRKDALAGIQERYDQEHS